MQIWAWGANSNGQCGLGYTSEQVSLPTEVPIVFSSPDDPTVKQTLRDYPNALPIKIEGGASDTVMLIENIPFTEPFEWQPNFQLLPYPKIRDIACGWDFSLYLSQKGVLHSRGNNGYSQLGRKLLPTLADTQQLEKHHHHHHHSHHHQNRPPKFSQKWDNNLNTGDTTDHSLGRDLSQVAAGLRHGIVTTSNLDMLVWGHNSHNQIGPSAVRRGGPGDDANEMVPMKVVESPKFATILDFPSGFETGFTHIACGKDFTVACDKEGYLYGCGANKYGTMCHAPQDVKGFQGFASIFEQIPNRFFPGNIAELKCGWAHVICLLDTGKVVSWGRNDLGQLGRDSVNPKFDVEPKTVQFPEKIVSIACGSEHNIALGNSGAVYTWGWNEHDNCGVPRGPNEPAQECIRYPVRIDIPADGRVLAVGCGAGSSYAVSSIY